MRRLLIGALFLMLLTAGCTIYHTFGPYMGKVVDKETGEPIEGAVVCLQFSSSSFFESSFMNGGWEMLTDANGEFLFPRNTVWSFRIFASWNSNVHSIVFKPGYGHGRIQLGGEKSEKSGQGKPEDKRLIKLPKLTTIEERRKNLNTIILIPPQEMKLFHRLINQEYFNVGLNPPH